MQKIDELRKATISLGLFHTLDCVGYSPQMVNLRRKIYRNLDIIHKHIRFRHTDDLRIVGSKAEGVSRLYESDLDLLWISKCAVCIEASIYNCIGSLSNFNSVYTIVPCLYHPGHFKLLLTRESCISAVTDRLRICLNPFDFGYWLSSKKFLCRIKSTGDESHTTAGPAVCTLNRPDQNDTDETATLPCICPSILGNWMKRYRKYNWPPKEIIQQISQMTGNLVPTGINGCHEEEIEWRLCFNEIEILLVENLNETQTKLYVCLKIIKKKILKLRHEITSYMMKNIVFWLSERYPQTDFRPNNLFWWVIKALRLLKRASKRFHFPYYMIPERNLIAEKISKCRLQYVVKQINNAIKLGPQLLWNCKKIKMAMTMSLPELQLYQRKTDELEWLELYLRQEREFRCRYLGLAESDWKKTDLNIAINARIKELFLGPWPAEVYRMQTECSVNDNMMPVLLR